MPDRRTCSIDECLSPVLARGWCIKHYNRWRKHGDPLGGGPSPSGFWAKVDKNGAAGCWIWTGSIHPSGYGQCRVSGRTLKVHRYAYELLVGPIPEGLELDHLCRVRHCVNPAHLEAVTSRVNVYRSLNPCGINARKTHCVHGHEFTPENTMRRTDGNRRCRTCHNARGRRVA